MRRTVLTLLAVVTAATLTACGSDTTASGSSGSSGGSGSSGDKPTVVASTNVWGDVVEQVAGDDATVTSLITSPDQDPHSFEATTEDQLELSKADLVVANGGGYDDFVGTMLDAVDTKPTLVDAVEVSGKTASGGEELNEHVWYDLPTVVKVAEKIAADLGSIDPDNASTYTANAQAFAGKVDALEQKVAALKQTADGEGVAVTEPVPVYLLEAAGLVNKTPAEFSEAIEEETDVPPTALQETLSLFSDKKVVMLAYNDQVTDATTTQVEQAAKSADIPVVGFTETLPSGKDYLTWMGDNVTAIGQALAG